MIDYLESSRDQRDLSLVSLADRQFNGLSNLAERQGLKRLGRQF